MALRPRGGSTEKTLTAPEGGGLVLHLQGPLPAAPALLVLKDGRLDSLRVTCWVFRGAERSAPGVSLVLCLTEPPPPSFSPDRSH